MENKLNNGAMAPEEITTEANLIDLDATSTEEAKPKARRTRKAATIDTTPEDAPKATTEATAAPTEAVPAREARLPFNGVPQNIALGELIEDGNNLIDAQMPRDKMRMEIREMEHAIQGEAICWGAIASIEQLPNTGGAIVTVMHGLLKVIIPAEDFFAHSGMKDMDAESATGKTRRYFRKGGHMINGIVSFVPKAISESAEGVPFVVASRKDAMDRAQAKYFYSNRAPAKVGSMAKASIISVGPRYVTVECLGVEATIGSGSLFAYEYVSDVSTRFKNGDALMVAIEKLEVDKENKAIKAIELSSAIIERSQIKGDTVHEGMINGRYKAVVVAVTRKHYVVIITSGVKIRGLVPIERYVGETPIGHGSEVILVVTNINKETNMVIGKCMLGN